jgi:hypothetical protein
MTSRRVRLILEVEDDAAPPRGQLAVEGQPPRAFSGWMQLGEAIEAAVATARGSRQADGPPPPGAPIADAAP